MICIHDRVEFRVDKRRNENFYFQEKDIIAAKENAVANAVQLAALQKSSHHPWGR